MRSVPRTISLSLSFRCYWLPWHLSPAGCPPAAPPKSIPWLRCDMNELFQSTTRHPTDGPIRHDQQNQQMIKLRNIEKRYQTKAGFTYVLRQINLDIAACEFVTI